MYQWFVLHALFYFILEKKNMFFLSFVVLNRCGGHIVTVYAFSYHPFYFDFHSASVIFDVSSGFYFWNVNRTPTWHLSKMFKVAFKDVSTKNSESTYWTILFVMLIIYFIYKVVGKKIQKGYIKLNYVVCLSDTGSSCHVTVMGSLIVLVNKRADWNVPVSYIKYMSPCSACGFSTKKNHQK
jgi:hypothetical protein